MTREERWRRVRCIEGEVEALLKEVRAAFFGEGGREMGGKRRATGVASLVTCILGFRCMLRRISIELWMGLGSPFIPDGETLEVFADAVDFVCSLTACSSPKGKSTTTTTTSTTQQPTTLSSLTESDFDSFWFPYVSHILCSLTSSLIRLSLATIAVTRQEQESGGQTPSQPPQTPTQQQQQTQTQTLPTSPRTNPLVMLSRLTTALRMAKDEAKWDMAGPALERAEGVAAQLKAPRETTGEVKREEREMTNVNVVAALEGRFPGYAAAAGAYHGGQGHGQAQGEQQVYQPAMGQYGHDAGRNGYGHPVTRDEQAGEHVQAQAQGQIQFQSQAQSPSSYPPRDQGEYPPAPGPATGHWQGHYAAPYAGHAYHHQAGGGHQYRGDEGQHHGHGHSGYPASHARMMSPQGFAENAAWGDRKSVV